MIQNDAARELHEAHGPYQHQQQKNVRTLLTPTAEKHTDPISTNCTKTHGPPSASTAEKHMDHYQHQLQKNTWTLESTAKKIHGPLSK